MSAICALLPHASWLRAVALSPGVSSKVLEATYHMLQEQTSIKITLNKLCVCVWGGVVCKSPHPLCLACVHMDKVRAVILQHLSEFPMKYTVVPQGGKCLNCTYFGCPPLSLDHFSTPKVLFLALPKKIISIWILPQGLLLREPRLYPSSYCKRLGFKLCIKSAHCFGPVKSASADPDMNLLLQATFKAHVLKRSQWV